MLTMNNLFTFRRLISLYEKRYLLGFISSSSSPKDIYLTMKQLMDRKQYKKVLDLFNKQGDYCSEILIPMALKASIHLNEYKSVMNIEEKLSEKSINNPYIQRLLLEFYLQHRDVEKATRLFSTSNEKSNHLYTTMFKGLISNNMSEKVLDLADQMQIQPDEFTVTVLLKACAQLSNDRAKQTGNRLLRQMPNRFQNNNVLLTSAITMLMRFGDVTSAEHCFRIIKMKDIITYGVMMKGYVENNMSEKALDLFEQMPSKFNDVIYTIAFNACAQLSNDRAKQIGRKLLRQLPKDFQNDNVLLNSAINMLMKFGDVTSAEHCFRIIKMKDIVTYGAMMKGTVIVKDSNQFSTLYLGYVENNMSEKALDLFEQMPSKLNDVIHIIVFNACAQLLDDRAEQIGRKLLRQLPKDFQSNNVVCTSAIDMLVRFGDVTSAEHLFGTIKKKGVVSYGAMINGYNINNEPLKSLKLFEEIKSHDIVINEIISIMLIGACARLGGFSKCQSIVDQIPSHLLDNQRIRNSLIHMWGKTGLVENAQQIFQSMHEPDAYTYSAMIHAFGLNHMGLEAVDLYRKMPNHLRDEVTYVCVLNACSHSALHHEAHSIFNEITHKTEQVVTAMVDCLSRLYLFDEAQKLLDDYEKANPPCSVMYMAILSGARNSRQYILAKQIYDRMKSFFADDKETLISGSILLSNIYSSLGNHQEAESIRLNRIKQLGNKVKPGLSWTEVNGEIVEFRAHDRSHPRSKEIHAEAKRISDELINYGHKSDSSWITRPLHDDETIESVLCGHSERLAIAFNFIQQTKPSVIQITKNLRVCGDCHQATKLIAKIRQCKIIVRDANCIHHFFPNGTCSCQDHF